MIEETMEIDEQPENDERLLRRPEIKRDEMGRFEQHGAGFLKKNAALKNDHPQRGHFQFAKHAARKK